MTRLEIFQYYNKMDQFNKPFDPWEFLELFHPNYYVCDNIAWMDDIDKYLGNEFDPADTEETGTKMSVAFPDRYDASVEKLRLFCQEMLRAVETYQSLRYPNGVVPY